QVQLINTRAVHGFGRDCEASLFTLRGRTLPSDIVDSGFASDLFVFVAAVAYGFVFARAVDIGWDERSAVAFTFVLLGFICSAAAACEVDAAGNAAVLDVGVVTAGFGFKG